VKGIFVIVADSQKLLFFCKVAKKYANRMFFFEKCKREQIKILKMKLFVCEILKNV